VDATIHWVSADHSVPGEVRLYDRLFRVANPLGKDDDFTKFLNPKSFERIDSCRLESSLKGAAPGSRYQFERLGYFCVDLKDSTPGRPVFNRVVTLRDSWAKMTGEGKK
jgi:glutaminyl-tRNA synthetase